MSVRMRHTSGHTRNRRSHHAISAPRLSLCVKCGAHHIRHHMCDNCGTYRGIEIIDVLAKKTKKIEKAKAKAEMFGQGGSDEKQEQKNSKEKSLDAETLSSK